MPVLPQLIRRLTPVIKSTFGSYHRSSNSNGSKAFWRGARFEKGAVDGPLDEWDPYDDLLTPKGGFLNVDGNSTATVSGETVAAKQASSGLSLARDGFTEGGTSVRDMESGLHR